MVISSLALREHYREGTSPCSISDKWDCGIVNKSDYAVVGGIIESVTSGNLNKRYYSIIAGIPVAAVGIAGYLVMAVLGVLRRYRLLLVCVLGSLAFSIYLSYVEDKILGVWCIYCVISAGIVVVMTLLTVGAVITQFMRGGREKTATA